MKNDFNRHGSRLTWDEYTQKIIALHTGLPPVPSKAQDEQTRRAELNLRIDHHLGVDFPSERREEMWKVAQKVEKSRIAMAFKIIAGYFASGRGSEKHMDGSDADADLLTKALVSEYKTVLDEEELNQFLGAPEDRVLPKNKWRNGPHT